MTATILSALATARELGGDALIARLIKIFREANAAKLAKLDAAVAAGDAARIAAGGHFMKSSAAHLGLTTLSEAAAALERHGSDGDLALGAALPLLESVHGQLAR